MTGSGRLAVVVLSSLIAGQAVALCGATGWELFTRYPSEEIEQANASDDLSRLFAGTGLNERLGALEGIESRFALGWLPSAAWGREAISVATLGGPALAMIVLGLVPACWMRRRRRTAGGGHDEA